MPELIWIGTASERLGPLAEHDTIEVLTDHGLVGEHHAGGRRQVTLIGAPDLDAIEAKLGRRPHPGELRRNLLISELCPGELVGQRFQLGPIELEGIEPCTPCERMDANLGPGGRAAMAGHGGLIARVVSGGSLSIGAELRL